MLDLRGVMWYNATTSGRFFFFGKKTDSTRLYPILYGAFRSFPYMVKGGTIRVTVMREAFPLGDRLSGFKRGKKYFRKAGGADMRVKITLACTECKQRNYNTMKNKKNDPDRLEMNKYCRFCRKHTLHKETK